MIEKYILKANKQNIIVWGTGGNFERFYSKFVGKILFAVDNSAEKWGKDIHGIKIFSPETLEKVNREDIIVICSAYFLEIKEQLAQKGFCNVYQYGHYVSQKVYKDIAYLVHENIPRKRMDLAQNAIVVQGPFIDREVTEEIFKYYHRYYNNVLLIASTWDDVELEMKKLLTELADEVVLSHLPDNGGIGNINYQMVSTLAGLEKAKEKGAQFVAKSRSNSLIVAKNIFEKYSEWDKYFSKEMVEKYGLKGRLLFWIANRHLEERLYFVDDYFMLGYVDDMIAYWKEPLDKRKREGLSYIPSITKYEVWERKYSAENYVPYEFCKKIKYDMVPEVKDNMRFYRDLFIIAEKEMEFSYKYPEFPNRCLDENIQLNGEWQKLQEAKGLDVLIRGIDYKNQLYLQEKILASREYQFMMQQKSRL